MLITAGPWVTELTGNESPSGTGRDMFDIMTADGMVCVAENVRESDAAAICAVPDMLAALRFVLNDLNSELDPETRIILSDTLAKAQG